MSPDLVVPSEGLAAAVPVQPPR